MNKYVDMHAHILPGMPCGPTDGKEALAMLAQLYTHSVKTVVATPTFDARSCSLEAFLQQRDCAYAQLQAAIAEAPLYPNVALGAEVVLCGALLHEKNMHRLHIADTSYVLIRLPAQETIDSAMLDLLARFHIASGLHPVIANADALLGVNNVHNLLLLNQSGAMLQISTAGLLSHETRNCALYLLGNHIAQFVSSAMQPASDSPLLIEAMRVLKRSLPLEKYKRIKNNAGMLLSDAANSEIMQ